MGYPTQRQNSTYQPKAPVVILHGVMDGQMWGLWEITDVANKNGQYGDYVDRVVNLGRQGGNRARVYDFMFAQLAGGAAVGGSAGGANGAVALKRLIRDLHGYRVAMPAYFADTGWDWWSRAGDDRNRQPGPPNNTARSPDAFALVYDWRQDNDLTARNLANALAPGGFVRENLDERLKDKKFILLCHSMGGLIARLALERHGASAHVESLITVGTPHHGSLKLPSGLLGWEMGPLNVPSFMTRVYRSVITRMPGPMQLSPSFMTDLFTWADQQGESEYTGDKDWLGPRGFHALATGASTRDSGEQVLVFRPDFHEWMGLYLDMMRRNAGVRQTLDSGSAPGGVRYYFLGVANKWTSYAAKLRLSHWTVDQSYVDATTIQNYGARGTPPHTINNSDVAWLPNMMILSPRVGQSLKAVRYRIYQEVGDARNGDLVGGDDTVPTMSALGHYVSGVTGRSLVNMGGSAAEGHSAMCGDPAVQGVVTTWLTRANVRQGCVIPNWDRGAAEDERRTMRGGS
jgi:Palmitoyl protein thioesterase